MTGTGFQIEFSLRNQKEGKIQAKPLQHLTKLWQRSKTTYFDSGIYKVVGFLENDDCGDDRW
jgi:hypothetical protein